MPSCGWLKEIPQSNQFGKQSRLSRIQRHKGTWGSKCAMADRLQVKSMKVSFTIRHAEGAPERSSLEPRRRHECCSKQAMQEPNVQHFIPNSKYNAPSKN